MEKKLTSNKKIHPKEKANIISLIFFWYIIKIFYRYRNKDIQEKDIHNVHKNFQSKKITNQMEQLWKAEIEHQKSPSITRVLIKFVKKKFIIILLLHPFFTILITYLRPWALSNVILFFQADQSVGKTQAYLYTLMLIATLLLETIYGEQYKLFAYEIGIQIKTAVTSLLFRKSLNMSANTNQSVFTGKILSATTKDVIIIQLWFIRSIELFRALFSLIILLSLIFHKIGVNSIYGICAIIICMAIQVVFGSVCYYARLQTVKQTDKRLHLLSEVFNSIASIKMYTWELYFIKKIRTIRKLEIAKLRLMFYLKVGVACISLIICKMAYLLLILGYISTGDLITANIIYYITTCFQKLTKPLTSGLPSRIQELGSIIACLSRIQEILLYPENLEIKNGLNQEINANVHINTHDLNNLIKKDLLKTGLYIVTGGVASGKTFLLKTIMTKTNVENKTCSYASQTPWSFSSSIKNNIIFGSKFNQVRYKEVLRVTSLESDLRKYPDLDETILQSNGKNLSKGQRARLNLCRALYKDADIYLIDNCLTHLNPEMQFYIFSKAIKNFLKSKLVFLVTDNPTLTLNSDNIINMSKNEKDFSTIQPSRKTIDKIDDKKSDFESEDKESDSINYNSELLPKPSQKETNIYREIKHEGKVKLKVYREYTKYRGSLIVLFLIFCINFTSEFAATYTQKIVSQWVNVEEQYESMNFSKTINATFSFNNSDENTLFRNCDVLTLDNCTNDTNKNKEVFLEKTTALFQTNSTNSDKLDGNYNYTLLGQRIIYLKKWIISAVVSCSLYVVFGYILFTATTKTSRRLHNEVAEKVINAKMSFYDQFLIGNILTRFSKDFYVIDEAIPDLFDRIIRTITITISIGVLVIGKNYVFAVSFIVLLFTIFGIYLVGINTVRSLRRLDCSTKAPVLDYVSVCMEGLDTIKAFNMSNNLAQEFDSYQDLHTSAHHTLEISEIALLFLFNCAYNLFILVNIIYFITKGKGESSGEVGLALTQLLVLQAHLQVIFSRTLQLEGQMTSLERVLEFTELEQEDQKKSIDLRENLQGNITFNQVRMSYKTNLPEVLKNVNFSINSKEKIGIIGATGAGKTSVFKALLRLYDVKGSITIDNINTKLIFLKDLRKTFSIVPHDAILFSGTIRSNIDPYNEYSDAKIWQTLELVKIKHLIADLDDNIEEYINKFSTGQKKLFNIARALIRPSKIMLLDEPTSDMDEECTTFINGLINELLNSYTVLTITHKQNSMFLYDKVMVVDSGQVLEFDKPSVLTNNLVYPIR